MLNGIHPFFSEGILFIHSNRLSPFYSIINMPEKLSLKWNDFQSNVSKSFRLLRKNKEENYLHDVTLVADDNKQVSAHRLVLSACSSYFKEVFENNAQFSHPLLCLNGVQSEDITNMLDYIYNGQVSIHPEHLDRFLEVAQRFQLEGLLQENQCEKIPTEKTTEVNNTEASASSQERSLVLRTDDQIQMPEPSTQEHDHISKDVTASSNILELEEKINEYLEKSGAGVDIVEIDDDLEEEEKQDEEDDEEDSDDDTDTEDDVELEEKMNEYLEVSKDGIFKCTLCGKTSTMFKTMMSHIEIYCYTKLKLNQKIATISDVPLD